MITSVALLRAINVGGRNPVPMPELRAMAEELGLVQPRTLLHSGNLVFRSALGHAELVRRLERETARRFGCAVDYVIRSAAEWDAIIAANPFAREAAEDPARLVLVCCTSVPEAPAVADLQAAIAGRETVCAVGPDLYITYPDGQGNSRLTIALIERRLATRGTARNWNTVGKIADLMRATSTT